MNCQDIGDILDNRDIAHLTPAQSSEVEAHLEGCAQCARDWRLHGEFAALPDMVMPEGFRHRSRALVASGPQADRSQRARSRFIVIGTLVVVAAAAALLVAYLWPAGAELSQAPIAQTSPGPVTDASGGTEVAVTDLQSDSEPGNAPAPSFLVFVAPLREPEEIAAAGKNDPVWPDLGEKIAEIERNPVRRNAFTAFRSALISELSMVAGIGLVESESQLQSATQAIPGFGLRITSSYGMSADGKLFDVGTRYIQMMVGVVRPKPDGAMTQPAVGSLIQSQLDLEGGACRTNPGGTTCGEVHSLAADVVRRLRASVFPPDADMTRERQARLLNASLEPGQRFKALEELLGPQGVHGRAALRDAATVRGMLALAAAGDPAMRARIWRAVRGFAEPDLLLSLQAAAINDADEARLEAVVTLAEDYVQDPRARATLETVANTDRRALVRALAERGLSGESSWRAYLNGSLRDANRSATERVEAFMYDFEVMNRQPVENSLNSPPFFDLLDEGAIDVLARLLPGASNEQPASERSILHLTAFIGSRYPDNDAVTDMLLNYLRHGKSSRARSIAAEQLGFSRRNDERVRAALRESLSSDPEPRVREQITRVMGEDFASATP